jgi:signal transduction histidine kinase
VRFIPRSLSGRLLAVALVLIVVALLAAGIAMYFALHRFVQGQVDGRLDGQILSVRDALRAAPDGSLSLDPVANGPPFERPHAGWYWEVMAPGVDLRSPSLGSNDFALAGPLPEYHPKPATADGTGPGDEPLRVRAQRFRFEGRSVVIASSAPRHALDGPLREAMTPVALTLGVLALALIGGVALQIRLGLRPLSRLTEDLQRVRTGRAERILGVQPSEVAPLVAELNSLLDQNAANLERARRHVANLPHGLKTPLATLAIVMDERGWYADGRLKPLVMTMDRRIRHHLSRARLAALGGPDRARTFLAPRVADHIGAFGKLYADKDLTYEARIAPDITLACEAQDLDELLGNLLDNAGKWARHRVLIAAVREGPMVEMTIEDDGPGLSDQQAVDVMRPGHRIDESAPGYGFGLPITGELAELCGGAFALGRSVLGGVRAIVTLPAARGSL